VVKALSAARKGSQLVAQVAAIGNTRPIVRFRLSLDGRRAAELAKRSSPFTVRLRGRGGSKLRVDALDAGGAVIAAATRTVRAVKRGKSRVRRGSGVGATVGIL